MTTGETELKRLPHSDRASLSGANFGLGDFNDAVAKTAAEALEADFTETPPCAFLPLNWRVYGDDGIGGPPVEVPDRIYFSLPSLAENLGATEGPTWTITLTELINYALDDVYLGGDPAQPIDDGAAPAMSALRDKLTELAAHLQAVIARVAHD